MNKNKIGFVSLYGNDEGGEIYLKRLILGLYNTKSVIDPIIIAPSNAPIFSFFNSYKLTLFKINPLNRHRNINVIFDFIILIFQISKILKKEKIDTLVLNGERAIYLSPFIRHITKIGIKHMLIEPPYFAFKKWLTRICFENSHLIVTISQFHCNHLREVLGYSAAKNTKLIYNGVNLNDYYPKEMPKSNKLIFLEVASFEPRKGQLDLLNAFSILAKKYANIHLWFAGTGRTELAIRNKINEFSLNERVALLGSISNVNEILNQIDVFVLPSYSEGLPLSILEAMACGKPIISTSIAGIPELVQNGINGFLYSPGNIPELTTHLESFVLNTDNIISMGQKSRQFAEENFDDTIFFKKWSEILNNQCTITAQNLTEI